MAPVLFADRFVVARPGRAVDLATGEVVWIRTRSFADHQARAAWLARCAALAPISSPHLVTLADFGAATVAADFEAWRCPPPPFRPWRRRDACTASALRAAVGCLVGNRVSVGRLRWSQVVAVEGRPAILPDCVEQTDAAASPEQELSRLNRLLEACGATAESWAAPGSGRRPCPARPRPAESAAGGPGSAGAAEILERVSEVLDSGVSGRPRAVSLAVQPGDRDATVRAIARCARLRGYIPLSARLLGDRGPQPPGPSWRRLLAGRHVAVLRDAAGGLATETGLFFLSLGLDNDRPHVLLTFTSARGSGARASWACCGAGPMQAREESAPYAADAVVANWTPALAQGHRYADPRRVILEAAACGRHAQVERWLRDAAGRSARRRDAGGAGVAEFVLGRLLLQRGQVSEASRALDAARHHFESARMADRAVCAGVFAGLLLTDSGRFCDAESALRAAVVAAATVGDEPAGAFARLGLARSLLWQGRFEESIECLSDGRVSMPRPTSQDDRVASEWRRLGAAACARERPDGAAALVRAAPAGFPDEWPFGAVHPDVARACLEARAAMAIGDLGAAGRATAVARAAALQAGRPTDLATACRARALLFSTLGDVAAARQQVDEGLHASRLAHDPLRALRLRLVLVEALMADGRGAEAKAGLARLARLDPRRLPAVVGRPLERLLRNDGEAGGGSVVVPFRQASSPRASSGVAGAPRPSLADGIIEVLGLCQATEDEREALRKVSVALRGRVRAVSLACAGNEHGHAAVLAADGVGRASEDVALRAVQSGLVIAPSSSRSGLEAAVPVRYGGEVIGAIACRWTADSAPDWAQAGALLAAAATAVAPCVRALLDRRAAPVAGRSDSDELLGVSDSIVTLRAEIARAAPAPFPVLIEGDSGSGKELVARAIHRLGPRANRPLCALNCAALTDELVEAELFGHARGAFTGAMSERKGLFEEAHQGTLVLDEVGELTPRAQAKLLRAIQEGEVRRLGENLPRAVEVRIVAATNRSLRAAVEAGAFRRDLLYRLEVIKIVVPPLRARIEDIPLLACHFWRQATARVGSRSTLAPATLAALARYDWPGNVRELQNVMAALAVSAGVRGSIGPDRLPAVIARQAAAHPDARNLEDARRVFEAAFVRAALARAGGRRSRAASDLGLTRQGLAKLMARLGIEAP